MTKLYERILFESKAWDDAAKEYPMLTEEQLAEAGDNLNSFPAPSSYEEAFSYAGAVLEGTYNQYH